MSEKVWKVVRVEGEKRLSAFCILPDASYPQLDYTGGAIVGRSVAFQSKAQAREFARIHSPAAPFEV